MAVTLSMLLYAECITPMRDRFAWNVMATATAWSEWRYWVNRCAVETVARAA